MNDPHMPRTDGLALSMGLPDTDLKRTAVHAMRWTASDRFCPPEPLAVVRAV